MTLAPFFRFEIGRGVYNDCSPGFPQDFLQGPQAFVNSDVSRSLHGTPGFSKSGLTDAKRAALMALLRVGTRYISVDVMVFRGVFYHMRRMLRRRDASMEFSIASLKFCCRIFSADRGHPSW